MKTRVKVTLVAEGEVEIEVEHEMGVVPCGLTDKEEAHAVALTSNPSMEWTVTAVRTVMP
jgi:hypothetical protein